MDAARHIVGLSALSILAGMASCGGTAVIDSGAGGGSTATGTGTATGTTTGTATGTTTGTGSGTGTGTPTDTHAYLCQQVCAQLDGCLTTTDCVLRCLDTEPACLPTHQSWLSCLFDELGGELCDVPPLCQDELAALHSCYSAGGGTCTGTSEGYVECTVEVGGFSLQASCQGLSGVSQCRCAVDGQGVGSCTYGGTPTDAADPMSGCCALLFYVLHF